MAKNTTDRDVLKELGFDALTDLCGTQFVFKKWLQRGIPWRARGHVAELAASKGISLPADFAKERRAA